MLLSELFDYKNRLMGDLVSNNEIVKLLHDDCKPVDEPTDLIYKQIFPFEHLPETAQHGLTYICFEVDIDQVYGKTFLRPMLYIWVFTHVSKMRMPEGGVRVDNICSEICKMLDGNRYYGLGELNLYSLKRFAPLTDWQGKQIAFAAKEFNRLSPTGKPAPSNRRLGELS